MWPCFFDSGTFDIIKLKSRPKTLALRWGISFGLRDPGPSAFCSYNKGLLPSPFRAKSISIDPPYWFTHERIIDGWNYFFAERPGGFGCWQKEETGRWRREVSLYFDSSNKKNLSFSGSSFPAEDLAPVGGREDKLEMETGCNRIQSIIQQIIQV